MVLACIGIMTPAERVTEQKALAVIMALNKNIPSSMSTLRRIVNQLVVCPILL
jgi:hypothetical protein